MHCPACGELLVMRSTERSQEFAQRTFCGLDCYSQFRKKAGSRGGNVLAFKPVVDRVWSQEEWQGYDDQIRRGQKRHD